MARPAPTQRPAPTIVHGGPASTPAKPATTPAVSQVATPAPVPLAGSAAPGDLWDRVRTASASTKLIATLLGELTFLGLREGVARLVGPREMVVAARNKITEIESLFRQATGSPVRVQIEAASAEVREPMAGDPSALAAPAAPRAPMQEHPLVRQAIDQLGATLVRIQPRVKPPGAS